LEFGDVGFCRGEPREKQSEQGKNQQQTQPTYGTRLESNPGHIVGGECSHHCTILAPQSSMPEGIAELQNHRAIFEQEQIMHPNYYIINNIQEGVVYFPVKHLCL